MKIQIGLKKNQKKDIKKLPKDGKEYVDRLKDTMCGKYKDDELK